MPDKKFWDSRYIDRNTGWDAGSITTPLKDYVDQLVDKSIKILIPGAGNAHEAEYLFKKGFKNTFVLDISEYPLNAFQERIPDFPDSQLLLEDFFRLIGTFDLIIEQTFFCAIDPQLREAYAKKAWQLLNHPGGKLVGVLFDDPLNTDKPPFGGTKEEYISYFRPYFQLKTFDTCYNSIPPRQGRELFINLVRKEKLNQS